MKVLALNSSARTGDVSKTEIILDFLLQGMRETGAEVELVELRRKKIKYCIGCFTCWTKTPGQCVIQDDMTNELFSKYLACDLLILASPLFHYTVNALMKTFIERTLPVALPFFEKREGVTRHPLRHMPPPVAIVSVAGFPEESVFDQLNSYAHYLFRDKLVAQVYRTSSEVFSKTPQQQKVADICEALVEGGRELAQSMKISEATMTRIRQPVTDFEKMAPIGNLMWQTCIDEGVTLGEAQKKGMVPRPDSIETFLGILQFGFNEKKSTEARLTIQFNFSGQVKGGCYVTIDGGKIKAGLGQSSHADLTIETPFEVWMDILTKKADGQTMFLEQKYTVKGDIAILMRMREFFGRD